MGNMVTEGKFSFSGRGIKMCLIVAIAFMMMVAIVSALPQEGALASTAGELQQMLEDTATEVIRVNETIVLSKPLVVTGEKKLVGNGTLSLQAQLNSIDNIGKDCVQLDFAGGKADALVTVASTGKLTIADSLTLDGSGCDATVGVCDGATLQISDQAMIYGGKYNVYLAAGSQLFMDGGTIDSSIVDGIYVEKGASAEVNGAIMNCGRHGIHNEGNAVLTKATLKKNQYGISNFGTMQMSSSILEETGMHAIVNERNAELTMVKSEINTVASSGIINQTGAKLKLDTIMVRRTGNRGIENAGGSIDGNDVTIYSCGTVPLENRPGAAAAGGDVVINKLTTSGATGINVVQGSSGKMRLTNSSIGLTSVTSMKLISGTMELDSIVVEGTTGTGAGIWITGGALDVSNSTIKDTKGRGLAIAGGTVTGKNLIIENIANIGIDNMPNMDGLSSGTAILDGVTIRNVARDNVANTSKGTMTISNSTLGVATANSVRVTDGSLILNNTKIEGTVPNDNGESSFHGVYSRGGSVTLNNCQISNCVAGGVRNRGSEVIIRNTTIDGTGGTAVSNGSFDDGSFGNITINGITVRNSKLGNILNESPGSIKLENAVLGNCYGNNVMIKQGNMQVTNVKIEGTEGAPGINHHGVYATGGVLDISNSTIDKSMACAIRNTGAAVTASGVVMSNSGINNVNCSGGTTTLLNCTMGWTPRTNLNLTAGAAKAVMDSSVINGSGDKSGNNTNCVYIANRSELVVKGASIITGAATRAGVLNEGGRFILENGYIYGNAQRGVNNANYVNRRGDVITGEFEMNGGEIFQNGNGTVSGGGVYNGGIFDMNAGSIHQNVANTGGAINTAANSETYISGGEIYKNHSVASTASNGNGGGIHASGNAKVISVSGGIIHGNIADRLGSAICHNAQQLVIGTNALVDTDNDIYLAAGRYIDISGSSLRNTAQQPITISLASPQYGSIVAKTKSEDIAQALKTSLMAKNNAVNLAKNGANIVIGDVDDSFNFCAQIGSMKYLTLKEAFDAVPDNGAAATTIEIIDNIELTAMVDIAKDNAGKNIILTDDGNGPYTISRADSMTTGRMLLLRKGNTLSIVGSGGDDSNPDIIFDGNNINAGSNAQIIAVGASTANWDATMTLGAGVRLQNGKNSNGGGAIIINGTLDMTGGSITSCSSAEDGGGIYVGTRGTLNMTGGSITGNSATRNGNGIYSAGTVKLGGSLAVDEIGLADDKNIELTSQVTTAAPISIKLLSYPIGMKVLTGSDEVLAASITKFVAADANYEFSDKGEIVLVGKPRYVAQIGSNQYLTLKEAFDAVPDNGAAATTIEIIDNIELTAMVDIAKDNAGKNIILTDDGNGPYTISRADSMTTGRMLLLRKGNTLSIVGSGGDDSNPDIIFDGNNINAGSNAQIIAVGASTANWDATMTLGAGVRLQNGKNSNGGGAIIINGTLDMTGGSITSCSSAEDGGGIYVGTRGTLNMTGGSITGNSATRNGNGIYSAGTVKLGGSLAVDEIGLADDKNIELTSQVTTAAPISVQILTYVPGRQVLAGDSQVIADSYDKFTMTNKDFSIDSTGTTIGKPRYVAQIGSNQYLTLKEAFDAVPDNGAAATTIEIIDNIELTAMVDIAKDNAGKNIILTDDGNGPYTISRADSMTTGRMLLLRKGNTLSIVGSGGDDSDPDIVLNGNNISAGKDAQIIAVGASTANWDATMTLGAGVRLQNGKNSNGGGAIIINGTLNMTGGSITSSSSAEDGGGIYVGTRGTLNMTGGSITGNSATRNGNGIYSAGTVRLGGSLAVDEIGLADDKNIELTSQVTTAAPISVQILTYVPGRQVLAGDSQVIADSYDKFTMTNKDFSIDSTGTTIGKPRYVAQIGSNQYLTLKEAFDAVPDNGAAATTIEIIDNIELTAMVDIAKDNAGKNIILTDDGNGPYTISRADSMTTGRMLLLRKGNTLSIVGSGGDDSNPDIIFDGNNINAGSNAQIIAVGASTANWDATMTLGAGVRLQNGKNSNGGGAIIINGTLDMTGGSITSSSSAEDGGGIYVGTKGTLNMTGGSITGNSATRNGNGIYSAGKVRLGGSLAVDEIGLANDKSIEITAPITTDVPIGIKLLVYTPDRQVITGTAETIADSYNKFVLADNGYTLDDGGKVQDAAAIVAAAVLEATIPSADGENPGETTPPVDGENPGETTPPVDGENPGETTPPVDGENPGETTPPADTEDSDTTTPPLESSDSSGGASPQEMLLPSTTKETDHEVLQSEDNDSGATDGSIK